MKNVEVYQQDPRTQKLVNEGVVNVNDANLDVLRYELETFVCDGQYQKGMSHILQTYLSNINSPQQPGVWVSGFYGSGKSHLVKMLRSLWENTEFPDGANSRGIASLPEDVMDHYRELSIQAKRYGGLHAASGTLSANSYESVRLALMSIVFKSVGLPGRYHLARFIMWLKKEGIYQQVKGYVEEAGSNWQEELDSFYVAEGLHQALVKAKPNLFASTEACINTLNNHYPYKPDISNDEMIKEIQNALSSDGVFPLTLIIIDELERYIGDDSKRSMEVQEVVEACCKRIGGKLLLIGTGQLAITGTKLLKKLEGRFTVRVELSDSDVDAVIRKVILAKKPEAKKPIEGMMERNIGEVSRHLSGTRLSHKRSDLSVFSQDYPLLPVRRRFWENTLRAMDTTGTDSQLRNQLSMVHKAIKTNLNEEIGNVIPADFLYFESAPKLLQARVLPRKVYDRTMRWKAGTSDEVLLARACGLIFLINKLISVNDELGVRATVDTVADLLIQDLSAGSANLRSKLPGLLDNCELLMKIGEEYRIQTEESTAWNDEYLSQEARLKNETHRIESEREDRLKNHFGSLMHGFQLQQGNSKVARKVFQIFDSELPKDSDKRICVWVRDGWSTDEYSVQAEARQAGLSSPTVFVFIPKRSSDELRRNIIIYKAALATLNTRGDGKEAKAAMETTKQMAEAKINELIQEAFSGVRVFQAGGNEITGSGLGDQVLEASRNSLKRLYPKFGLADNDKWSRVYDMAKKGAPDALKSVGHSGDVPSNPVCKAVMGAIASGKEGSELRQKFETTPYGWSRDAIDGALQVLLVSGQVKAIADRKQLNPLEIERKAIGKLKFKIESTTVTTRQNLEIRKLYQKVGIIPQASSEALQAQDFVAELLRLADDAGGDSPRPQKPLTGIIEEIRLTSGNEQLLAIYNRKEDLAQLIDAWKQTGKAINDRMPRWDILEELLKFAGSLDDVDIIQSQCETIQEQRQVLDEPDPVPPIILSLTQMLRDELNNIQSSWEEAWEKGNELLENDMNWGKLEQPRRYVLRDRHHLVEVNKPVICLESTDAIITTLKANNLRNLLDNLAAIPGRFKKVIFDAAKEMEPKIREVEIPLRTLKTEADIDSWLQEIRKLLTEKLKNGPIRPS